MRIGLNRLEIAVLRLRTIQNTVKVPKFCVSIPFSVIYTFNTKLFSKSFRNRVV